MPAGRLSGAIDITAIKYNWRGEWKSSGVYSKNDVVRYRGRTYYCKTDALFEQGLFGPEYGPNRAGDKASSGQTSGLGERIASAAPVTWESSSNVFIAGRVANANNIENIATPTRRFYTEISKSPTSAAGWDGHAYTREFFTTSALASAKSVNLTDQAMFGLNVDPATNTSFTSLDFAWYLDAGTCRIYENGTLISSHGTYTPRTDLTITFNGNEVQYWKDGVQQRVVARTVGLPLYFDCSIFTANGTLTEVTFGPGNEDQYWEVHTDGYLYRGGWMAYRRYYPGDVVKCRGDVFACIRENFNGHPLYKNGLTIDGTTRFTSPDWKKLASGTTAADDDYVEILPNMPPLGWTRYMASWFEPGHQRTRFTGRWFTASGKIYATGRGDNVQNGGNGISTDLSALSFASPAASMSMEHWDYRYGRLPGHLGRPPKCIQLVGNGYWAAALFDNGEVHHWGYGAHGQNGDGTNNNNTYPKRCGYVSGTHDYRNSGTSAGILATTKIIKIAGGSIVVDDNIHSMICLDANGEVWTWGYNGFGQLGHGDYLNRNVPTKIDRRLFNDKDIVDIWTNSAATNTSVYAIDSEGRLWAWGYNVNGQLGLSTTKNITAPELVKYDWNVYGGIKKVSFQGKGTQGYAMVLTNDGTIHGVGDTSNTTGGDIFGPGVFHMGLTLVFRPYPDILKGYEQALGQDHRTKQAGAYIDVCRNVEDFWIIGGEPSTTAIYIKEKNTGLIYSWGYNYNNSLMHTASMWLRPADSGTYYTTNNYFPMPCAVSAPDLVFMGRSMDRGYRTVAFITESGRAYTAGGNFQGEAGWGYDSVNGQSQVLISGQNDYDSMSTTETSGNRTYFPVRQSERLAVCGGVMNYWGGSNIPVGGIYWVSEDGILLHTGWQDRQVPAGSLKWGSEILEGGSPGDAYSPATPGTYAGISGMSNNHTPNKVWY
jgi:hypothetical protein